MLHLSMSKINILNFEIWLKGVKLHFILHHRLSQNQSDISRWKLLKLQKIITNPSDFMVRGNRPGIVTFDVSQYI